MCSPHKLVKYAEAGLGLLMPYQIAASSRFLYSATVSALREPSVGVFADLFLQLVVN